MPKRKTYKSSYTKKSNFNKIARNYFKAKFSISRRIGYDTAGIKFIEDNDFKKTISSLLTECPDFKKFQQIFHTMKLTGILIQTAPNTPTDGTVALGTMVLGLQTVNDTEVFADVVESNDALILTPTQAQRKYIPLNGGMTAWVSAANPIDFAGRFVVKTDANAQDGGYMISVRFTFYVTFKNAN